MDLFSHPPRTLFICGFGRPAMQYAHALFDGHPDVLIVPAILKFHMDWVRRGCEGRSAAELVEIWCSQRNLTAELARGVPAGLRLDTSSRRDYVVDGGRFRRRFHELLVRHGTNRRSTFLALHQAYSDAAGHVIRPWIVENAHSVVYFNDLLADFPNAKLLVLVREPRSALASCLRKYAHRNFADPLRLYTDLIADGYVRLRDSMQQLPADRLLVVRSEDLTMHTASTMRQIADWAGLAYSPSLAQPTRAGQLWISNSTHAVPALEKFDDGHDLLPYERALMDLAIGTQAQRFGYNAPSQSFWWRAYAFVGLLLPNRHHLQIGAEAASGNASKDTRLLRFIGSVRRVPNIMHRVSSLALLPMRLAWIPDLLRYRDGTTPSQPYSFRLTHGDTASGIEPPAERRSDAEPASTWREAVGTSAEGEDVSNPSELAEPVRISNLLTRGVKQRPWGWVRSIKVAAKLALHEQMLAGALLLMIVIEALSAGGTVLYVRYYLERLVGSNSLRSVWVGAAVLLAIWVVRTLAGLGVKVWRYKLARAIELHARVDVLDHLMKLSVGFLENHSRAELIQRVNNDTAALREALASAATAISSLARVVALTVVAYMMDPVLTIAGLAAVPFTLPLLFFIGHQLERDSGRQRQAAVKLVDLLVELMSGIRTIKAYSGEERERRFHRASCKEIYEATGRTQQWQAIALSIPEFALGLGLVVIVLIGGHRLVVGAMEWPALLGFMMAVLGIQGPVSALIQSQSALRASQPYADRYFELLRVEPQVREPDLPIASPVGAPTIEFRSVTYTAGTETILHDVSFSIRAGETIGVVGPTGSGKTTLLNLVGRFVDPTEGTVLHSGVDVRSMSQVDLMSHLALVTQDAFLFATDVATNIAYGRPGASEEEIRSAARAAGVLTEIDAMTDGLRTPVGLGGRPVSGGQAQRISIARALLKDAPLLLLDEATSALDSETEVRVQRAIERYLGTRARTTLIVAHRLSTLRTADRILVLDNGRVVGFGRHAELMATCSVYQRLAGNQGLPSMDAARTVEGVA